MTQQLISPYHNDCTTWLKGNLHTHTTNSDGNSSPQDTINAYAALGYDFLMLSDHDHLTQPIDYDPQGMALIPGNEITAYGSHILHVNAHRRIDPEKNRQYILDAIEDDGGFSIINHPHWEKHFNHCPYEKLDTWQGYAGIEIYNGVCRRAEGSPLATDHWDRLLSAGRRIWGFAHDDTHEEQDRGVAWLMLQSPTRSIAKIVDALHQGSFYASTGVEIQSLHITDTTITLDSPNAQCYYIHTDHGCLLSRSTGDSLTFTLPHNFPGTYIRIQCFGPGDTMAWLQPLFINHS